MGAVCASGRDVARYVCFAAFMSTLFIYSPNVMTLFAFDAAEYTGSFAEPCLIATLACACVLLVAELLGKSGPIKRFASAQASKCACCIAYLVSCLLFVVSILFQLSAVAAFLAPIGVICGVCLVGVSLLWAEAFHDVDLFRATIAIVGALLLSATLHAVSGLCPWYGMLVVEIALLLCGTLPLMFTSFAGAEVAHEDEGASVLPEDASEQGGPGFGWRACKGRAFASIMGIPLVGMAISSLAIGVRPFYVFDNTVNAQVLSMFLAVLLAVPLVCLRKKQPLYVFVYQVYLPALIALATALAMVFQAGVLAEIVCVVLCATFTLATAIAISASVAISNAREFPRGLVFATLIAVYSGLGITGIRVGASYSMLYENNQSFLTLLAVLYTCGMLVFASIKLWAATTRSAEGEHIDSPALQTEEQNKATETFEERLERISQQAGLSARERQIMSYVGRGHTSVYVAKTLLISDSTVYTHVRNIYRKLGITSREELILLFNDAKRS